MDVVVEVFGNINVFAKLCFAIIIIALSVAGYTGNLYVSKREIDRANELYRLVEHEALTVSDAAELKYHELNMLIHRTCKYLVCVSAILFFAILFWSNL